MNGILNVILVVFVVGIVSLLCLFSCFISNITDEFWDDLKKEMEKRKNERR